MDYQQLRPLLNQSGNRFPLPVTELRCVVCESLPESLERLGPHWFLLSLQASSAYTRLLALAPRSILL